MFLRRLLSWNPCFLRDLRWSEARIVIERLPLYYLCFFDCLGYYTVSRGCGRWLWEFVCRDVPSIFNDLTSVGPGPSSDTRFIMGITSVGIKYRESPFADSTSVDCWCLPDNSITPLGTLASSFVVIIWDRPLVRSFSMYHLVDLPHTTRPHSHSVYVIQGPMVYPMY